MHKSNVIVRNKCRYYGIIIERHAQKQLKYTFFHNFIVPKHNVPVYTEGFGGTLVDRWTDKGFPTKIAYIICFICSLCIDFIFGFTRLNILHLLIYRYRPPFIDSLEFPCYIIIIHLYLLRKHRNLCLCMCNM